MSPMLKVCLTSSGERSCRVQQEAADRNRPDVRRMLPAIGQCETMSTEARSLQTHKHLEIAGPRRPGESLVCSASSRHASGSDCRPNPRLAIPFRMCAWGSARHRVNHENSGPRRPGSRTARSASSSHTGKTDLRPSPKLDPDSQICCSPLPLRYHGIAPYGGGGPGSLGARRLRMDDGGCALGTRSKRERPLSPCRARRKLRIDKDGPERALHTYGVRVQRSRKLPLCHAAPPYTYMNYIHEPNWPNFGR